MTSDDGLRWETPSAPLLENAYAPTLFWEDDHYRLWYTDVTADPWTIRAAQSDDGFEWQVHPQPVLEIGPGMGVPAPGLSSRSQRRRLLSDVVRQL